MPPDAESIGAFSVTTQSPWSFGTPAAQVARVDGSSNNSFRPSNAHVDCCSSTRTISTLSMLTASVQSKRRRSSLTNQRRWDDGIEAFEGQDTVSISHC